MNGTSRLWRSVAVAEWPLIFAPRLGRLASIIVVWRLLRFLALSSLLDVVEEDASSLRLP